ncbi:MAG: trypsin-like serine protease [Erythrobacter sp.]
MTRTAFRIWAGLAAIAFSSVGVSAQPDEDLASDLHYPTYSPYFGERATIDKPPDQIASENQQFLEYEADCETGDRTACRRVGLAYLHGIGAKQVRPVAAIYFAEACAGGDAESCLEHGRLHQARATIDGQPDAAKAFERSCNLGSAEGCIEFAFMLENGSGIERDLARAEALLRDSCGTGSIAACRRLGSMLIGDESRPELASEGVLLFQSACRAGDVESCEQLHSLYGEGRIFDSLPHEPEVLYAGCNAGGASFCKLLGDRALLGQGVLQDESYAFMAYDRACALDEIRCSVAETMRAAPQLRVDCGQGDAAACARMGEIGNSSDTIYFDPEAARNDFVFACRGGVVTACTDAGYALLSLGIEPQSPEAASAREFFEIGCEAGNMLACTTAAQSLYEGGVLGLDRARALEFYAILCAEDRDTDCEVLEEASRADPTAPLPVAGSNYLPPDDPETGESSVERYWADQRAEDGDACTTNTVEFRDEEYSDTICDVNPRVRGGRELRPGDAPWQALIWRPERLREIEGPLSPQGRVKCGGSVIARGWVLTAAHCMVDYGRAIVGRGYTIRLGVHNPHADEGVSYPIITGYIHPNYDPDDYAYDIALIRYDAGRAVSAPETNSISTILPDKQSVASRRIASGMPVYVYGWGWTRATRGTSTAGLRSARLNLTSLERCTEISEYTNEPGEAPKLNSALCAGAGTTASSCKGDSGGPLIYYGDADRVPRVVGVVSTGIKCGQTGIEGLYTRVGHAWPWIARVMRTRP